MFVCKLSNLDEFKLMILYDNFEVRLVGLIILI